MEFAASSAYIGIDDDEELAVREDELQSESLIGNLERDRERDQERSRASQESLSKRARRNSRSRSPASASPEDEDDDDEEEEDEQEAPSSKKARRKSRLAAESKTSTTTSGSSSHNGNRTSSGSSSSSSGGVKSSSSSSPARRVHHHADTNVVVVKFATLANNADDLFAGDPTECKKCGAILSNTSVIQKRTAVKAPLPVIPENTAEASPMTVDVDVSADDSKHESSEDMLWKCEFCHEENVVDLLPEEIPKTESRDYVLDPVAAVDEEKKSAADNGLVIFVIDISGSMCSTTEVPGKMLFKGVKHSNANFDLPPEAGFANASVAPSNTTWVSRLQCMQAAVNQQIEEWKRDQPDRKVGIVTFNREVTVIGDGSGAPEVIVGDKLGNHDELVQIGKRLELGKTVRESSKTLSDRLFALDESGPTALGPALVVAVSMASKVNGSRVVVCTDGLANVGVGALDKQSCPNDAAKLATENWYEGLGNMAKLAGVCVSIISIKGEECDLEALGKVAEITGGDVMRVDPLELHKNFSSMLAKPIIATKVSATFLLHSGLTFRNEADDTNKVVREVGNVTEDTEIAFEYGVRSDEALRKYADLKVLPFQVQIRFVKLNGMKCLRLLSKAQPVTRSRQEAEKDVRLEVLAANVAQQSAKMAERGDFRQARTHNLAYGKLMKRYAAQAPQSAGIYRNWVSGADSYHSALMRQEVQMNSLLATPREFAPAASPDAFMLPQCSALPELPMFSPSAAPGALSFGVPSPMSSSALPYSPAPPPHFMAPPPVPFSPMNSSAAAFPPPALPTPISPYAGVMMPPTAIPMSSAASPSHAQLQMTSSEAHLRARLGKAVRRDADFAQQHQFKAMQSSSFLPKPSPK